MFSPRLNVFVALVAVAATYPANDAVSLPTSTGQESDIVESTLLLGSIIANILGPLTRLFSSSADIGPKIDVDDNRFRIIVNVRDYKKNDLKVKVKNDFIFVQGSQEAKQDDHDLLPSNFFHNYSLPVNASASEVTATLYSDGYLIVDAPLNCNGGKDESVDRVVPIVENGEPYKKKNTEDKVDEPSVVPASAYAPVEIDGSKVTTGSPTTVTDFDDDRKEPTTPSNREKVTNNSIPNDQMNEVSDANEVKL